MSFIYNITKSTQNHAPDKSIEPVTNLQRNRVHVISLIHFQSYYILISCQVILKIKKRGVPKDPCGGVHPSLTLLESLGSRFSPEGCFIPPRRQGYGAGVNPNPDYHYHYITPTEFVNPSTKFLTKLVRGKVI